MYIIKYVISMAVLSVLCLLSISADHTEGSSFIGKSEIFLRLASGL
jgi:hypothetical protein